MQEQYERLMENLTYLGVSESEANDAINASRDILHASVINRETPKQEAYLSKFLGKHGLLLNPDMGMTIDEGLEKLALVPEGGVIGLTGKPASGKSTILNQVHEMFYIIDEFWTDLGHYKEKVERMKRASGEGKRVLVAACQLDPDLIPHRFHLVSPRSARLHNLETRGRGFSDGVRSFNYDRMDLHDALLYDSEFVRAEGIINTTTIRY